MVKSSKECQYTEKNIDSMTARWGCNLISVINITKEIMSSIRTLSSDENIEK